MITVTLDVNCGNCRHRDHSGAFTPGGAKDVCNHDEAPKLFYPGDMKDFDAAKTVHTTEAIAKAFPDKPWPFDWSWRVVDKKQPDPPQQCPLRHGFKY